MQENAVVLLDKREGFTSFASLGLLKKALGRHCGHAGTLDKFASGLLIAFSGKFTKLNDVLMGLDKQYVAKIHFGVETDTLDPEGSVVKEADVPVLDCITEALKSFSGTLKQAPPRYSAIHIDGQRSYKLARSGVEKEMPLRDVQVYETEVLGWENPDLTIRLRVSKGFYVRSFARDLAYAAGSCGSLTELRRISIGPFDVGDAVPADDIEQIREAAGSFDPVAFLKKLPDFDEICLSELEAVKFSHGTVPVLESNGKFHLLLSDGRLAGVLDKTGKIVVLI